MEKSMSYDKTKKEMERSLIRIETINNDYTRDEAGKTTYLVVDCCDLIYYLHTKREFEFRDLTTKQRITRNYFQNEAYPLVIFPYHAYEFLKYIFKILESLHDVSTRRMSVANYIQSRPSVMKFLRHYNKGEYEEAMRLWKSVLWKDVISLIMTEKENAKDLITKPLKRFIALSATNRLTTVFDILGIDIDPLFIDQHIYESVLSNLNADPNRAFMDTNNEVDALAAGLSKGLNEIQDEYYFSLSTLAPAPLSAYSRSTGYERTMLCRNTCVSSYRLNILNKFGDKANRSKFVKNSIATINAALERFGSLKNIIHTEDSFLSGVDKAKTVTSAGYLMEYYHEFYLPIVSPLLSETNGEIGKEDNFWNFAEALSDEGTIISGFSHAIKDIIEDIKNFSESITKYTTNHGEVMVAGIDIKKEISEVLSRINDIGKEHR